MKTQLSLLNRGFSMIEVIVAVAGVGALSSVAMVAASHSSARAHRAKLESNVAALNRSVTAYLASGGALTGNSAASVISDLKGVASNQSVVAGYRGAFVDHRLEPTLSTTPATSDHPLILWDNAVRRFVISDTAMGGISDFRLNETLAGSQGGGARETPLNLAQSSAWVWDYTDEAVSRPAADAIGATEVDDLVPPSEPSPVTVLTPPGFSLTGGPRPAAQFPLSLTLANPNGEQGAIMYSVDGSAWQAYSGVPFSVLAGQTISAYVSSEGSPNRGDSYIRSEIYLSEEMAFAGAATGEFVNPQGLETMVATVNGDQFEWGQPVVEEGFTNGSTLAFTGASFSDVGLDQYFQLGTLTYFNSTIVGDTGATHVTLNVNLSLSFPAINEAFAFELDIFDTPNVGTEDENADYVWLLNPNATFTTSIGDDQYALNIAFGYLGAQGFATADQFHVHEGATATADLIGQFVMVAR